MRTALDQSTGRVLPMTFVVMDSEVTALRADEGEIIRIKMARYREGKEVARYDQWFRPTKDLSKTVEQLLGITKEDLRSEECLKDHVADIDEWIGEDSLVIHHAAFDRPFFESAWKEGGVEFNKKLIDTLAIYRDIFPNRKDLKLANCALALGIDAVDPLRWTAQMFMRLNELQKKSS